MQAEREREYRETVTKNQVSYVVQSKVPSDVPNQPVVTH